MNIKDMNFPIPKNSAKALIDTRGNKNQNAGLLFDRFTPDLRNAPGKKHGEIKSEFLKMVRDAAKIADKKLLEGWNKRWKQIADESQAITLKLSTDWRFITGLGKKGALEVGFAFHRYGFPFLPGSSVKGVARAQAIISFAEKHNWEKLNELDDRLSEADKEKYEAWEKGLSKEAQKDAADFRCTFGTTDEAGQAIFFDAVPDAGKLPELELDIINPHYPDYYSDNSNTVYPTNWQNPIPVHFLTVKAGTVFHFAVGWRGQKDHPLRGNAEGWLKEGLLNLGAGAKTSAGYGYWNEAKSTDKK